MKVSVVRGGGLAGLVTTTTVDEMDLGANEASELRAAVARAQLDRQPDDAASSDGRPDRFAFEVTSQDGDQKHIVRVAEQDCWPELRELMDWIDRAPGRHREISTFGP
jgi:hypothetical protein